MRVVHITYSYTGGAGRAAWRLHEALLEAGVDSWFLTMDDDAPDQGRNWVAIVEKEIGNRPSWFQLNEKFRSKQRFNLRKQAKALIPKLEAECITHPFSRLSLWSQDIVKTADIINLHWASGTLLDYDNFFRQAKKPIVWTLHDQHAFLGLFHYAHDMQSNALLAGDIDQQIISYKIKAIAASAQHMQIVAPSMWLTTEAKHSKTFKNLRVVQIPYSLNLNVYKPLNKLDARRRLGLPVDGIILLFVADKLSNYRKGFDLLHAALKSIQITGPVHLVAIGKKTGLSIEAFSIIEAGVVHGEEVLAAYYNAADAFVIPSREDNLPNVMLESMACGTPVIGFKIGGVAEHVADGITGYLAEYVSSDSLAVAIQRFIESPDVFNSSEIRQYAEQRFSNEIQASSYIDVYQAVLNE